MTTAAPRHDSHHRLGPRTKEATAQGEIVMLFIIQPHFPNHQAPIPHCREKYLRDPVGCRAGNCQPPSVASACQITCFLLFFLLFSSADVLPWRLLILRLDDRPTLDHLMPCRSPKGITYSLCSVLKCWKSSLAIKEDESVFITYRCTVFEPEHAIVTKTIVKH